MKKLLWAALFVLFQGSLWATTPLLLQMRTHGGYVPPEYQGHENGISIYRNGLVESFSRKNHLSPFKKVALAKLSQTAIRELLKKVETFSPGELVSDTPEAPICMDVPDTDYKLWKNEGNSFAFARDSNCHHYYLASGQSRNIKNLLSGFKVAAPERND